MENEEDSDLFSQSEMSHTSPIKTALAAKQSVVMSSGVYNTAVRPDAKTAIIQDWLFQGEL